MRGSGGGAIRVPRRNPALQAALARVLRRYNLPAQRRTAFRSHQGRRGIPSQGLAQRGREGMLRAVAVLLLILWMFGIAFSYTLGGFIHTLLVLALASLLLPAVQKGRSERGLSKADSVSRRDDR